jgi:hypothetical protein
MWHAAILGCSSQMQKKQTLLARKHRKQQTLHARKHLPKQDSPLDYARADHAKAQDSKQNVL